MNKEKWSVMGFWNKLLEAQKHPPKKRDYISASDIGKDYWNRYQKMMGVEPTNPITDRVRRIFNAGNEFHNLMKNVFKALGIFKNSQDEGEEWSVIPKTAKTMKVIGKYDILAGGKVDLEQVKKQCKRRGLSDFAKKRTLKMAEFIKENYRDGLPEMIYEIKSINSMAFWHKKDYLQEAYPHHQFQLYAYLKANNIKEGRILYISKDDLVTAEFPVVLGMPKLEKPFNEDLKTMTHYWRKKKEPPKPKYIVYNPHKKFRFQYHKKKRVIKGCYDYNWEVGWSQYLTLLTGCENEKEWKKQNKEKLKEMNKKLKEKRKKKIDEQRSKDTNH